MNYHKYRIPTEEYFSNRPVLASTSRLPPPVLPIPCDAHPNETSGYGIRLASPPKIVDTTVPLSLPLPLPLPPAASSRGSWRGPRGARVGSRSEGPFRGRGAAGRGRASNLLTPAHAAMPPSPSSHASDALGSRLDPLAKGKGRQTDDGRSSSKASRKTSRWPQQNALNGATAIETVSTVAAQRERDGPPSNTVVVELYSPQTTNSEIETLFAHFGSIDDIRLCHSKHSKQVPPLPFRAFIDFTAHPSAVRALSLDQTANLGSPCIKVKASTPRRPWRDPKLVGAWDDGPVAHRSPAVPIASSSILANRNAGPPAAGSSSWVSTPTFAPSQAPSSTSRLPPPCQPTPGIPPPPRKESTATLPPITAPRAPPPTPPHSVPSPRPGSPASERRADSEPLLIERIERNVTAVPMPAEGELVERVLLPANCRGPEADLKQRDTFRLRELRRMTKADKLYSNTFYVGDELIIHYVNFPGDEDEDELAQYENLDGDPIKDVLPTDPAPAPAAAPGTDLLASLVEHLPEPTHELEPESEQDMLISDDDMPTGDPGLEEDEKPRVVEPEPELVVVKPEPDVGEPELAREPTPPPTPPTLFPHGIKRFSFDTEKTRLVVEDFVPKYLQRFDEERHSLIDFYTYDAELSLRTVQRLPPRALGRGDRFPGKLAAHAVPTRVRTPTPIVHAIRELPAGAHLRETLVIDAFVLRGGRLCVVLHGAFEEFPSKVVRDVDRTWILAPKPLAGLPSRYLISADAAVFRHHVPGSPGQLEVDPTPWPSRSLVAAPAPKAVARLPPDVVRGPVLGLPPPVHPQYLAQQAQARAAAHPPTHPPAPVVRLPPARSLQVVARSLGPFSLPHPAPSASAESNKAAQGPILAQRAPAPGPAPIPAPVPAPATSDPVQPPVPTASSSLRSSPAPSLKRAAPAPASSDDDDIIIIDDSPPKRQNRRPSPVRPAAPVARALPTDLQPQPSEKALGKRRAMSPAPAPAPVAQTRVAQSKAAEEKNEVDPLEQQMLLVAEEYERLLAMRRQKADEAKVEEREEKARLEQQAQTDRERANLVAVDERRRRTEAAAEITRKSAARRVEPVQAESDVEMVHEDEPEIVAHPLRPPNEALMMIGRSSSFEHGNKGKGNKLRYFFDTGTGSKFLGVTSHGAVVELDSTKQDKHTLHSQDSTVRVDAVTYSPHKSTLLVGYYSTVKGDLPNQVVLYKIKDGVVTERKLSENPHTDGVQSISLVDEKKLKFATGGFDKRVRIWNVRKEKKPLISTLNNPKEFAHTSAILGLDYADGTLVSCALDKRLVTYDLEVGGPKWCAMASAGISAAHFLPNNPNLVLARRVAPMAQFGVYDVRQHARRGPTLEFGFSNPVDNSLRYTRGSFRPTNPHLYVHPDGLDGARVWDLRRPERDQKLPEVSSSPRILQTLVGDDWIAYSSVNTFTKAEIRR